MRVPCFLRNIRGDRTIRDVELESGISRGQLSYYERGRAFPSDEHRPILEQVYGAPASDWYPRELLLLLEPDRDQEPADA